MKRNIIETVMGGVVLLMVAAFLILAYMGSGITRVSGYEVTAQFNRVDGLGMGSDVRMSGIKVGTVVGLRLNPETYLAEVRVALQEDLRLPADSTARIQSDGLLSDNYVLVEPGAEEAMIAPGGSIQFTQDPVNLADLISRFVFSAANKKADDQPAQ